MATSSSSDNAIASASIENGSDPGVANAANTNRPKIKPAPPRLEALVGQHADEVEHDDQQWELEADAENQQQVEQEPEVLLARQRGDLDVAADGQRKCSAFAITM